MKKFFTTLMLALMIGAMLTACGGADNSSAAQNSDPSTTQSESRAETGDTSNNAGDQSKSDQAYTVLHGTLLDANPDGGTDGNTLVIKVKITGSYSNKATVDQNYYNIEDIVKNQGGTSFECIDYWAVADMSNGEEAKVVAFTVSADTIRALSNGNIATNKLGEYVDDLYIHPSLQ